MPRNLEGLRVTRTLSEVAAGITRATPSREASRRLMATLAPMGFEYVVIARLNAARTAFHVGSRDLAQGAESERWEDVPFDREVGLPFYDVVSSGTAVELAYPARTALGRYPDLALGRAGALDRAWRFVPLTWAGIVHGVVGIASPGPTAFEEPDRLVIEIFASETSRVLERCAGLPGLAQWTWNAVTGDVEWSDAKRAMHGLPDDAPVPPYHEFVRLLHPEDKAAYADAVGGATARLEPYDIETRVRVADGSFRWLRTRAHPIRGVDGVIRWYGTDEDITERKDAERERRELQAKMQQAQKLESLGTLAGGIAHDFNNLLVGVLGNVTLVRRELPGDAQAQAMLEDIERGAQRAADLTRQLLAYAGKGRFVVRTLDVAEVVLEMRALLGTAISKRARLHLEAPVGEAWVEADATQLRQVVMNLITNASDALGDTDGLITVRTGVRRCDRTYLESTHVDVLLPEGDYVFIEVTDTGRGIAPDALFRIFEPFFTTKLAGHGLGLAATLGIVRGHKGTIKVYSELGRGSAFRVLLPLVERPGRRTPAKGVDAHADWRPGGTVLVVDDEATVRQVARRALERAGFTVAEAKDGADAVRQFDALGSCAAVLLDLTMPELPGDEVLRAIRARAPEQAVVLMSGYNEQDVTNRVVGRGHAGFLQKPFTVSELLGAVRAAIES